MEVSVGNDPELATEVITLLGKELKIARERIRELETQVQHGVTTRVCTGRSLYELMYRVEPRRVPCRNRGDSSLEG